jgi:oligoribonuclease NrnB/cAMP/cGMP phosphodiesterase (DHH superfamily)
MNFVSKRLDKDNVDIVIYHDRCPDGQGGAFAVWYYYKTKFGEDRANNIYYKPASHGGSITDDFYAKLNGKNVVIVDFSYKYEILMKIIEVAKSFVILDHHKSAQEDLVMIPNELKIFDMQRSGAVIAWDFFMVDKPIPQFLLHIQDRDLWKNSLEGTNEFVTHFYEKKFDFYSWEKYMDDTKCQKSIRIGRYWLEHKKLIVSKAVKVASRIIQNVDGMYVIIAYSSYPTFGSEIGSELLNKYPLIDFSASCLYKLHKDETCFSLRSTNDRFDVSKIAVKHSGGGHRNAAGLRISGLYGALPYDRIKSAYLEVLEKMIVEYVEQENDKIQIKIPYILLDCTEFGKKFFKKPDQLFVDLIHRKFKNSGLVIFQIIKKLSGKFFTPSYNIIHNPMYVSKETKRFRDKIPIEKSIVTNSIISLDPEISSPGEEIIRHCLKSTLLSLFSTNQ